MIDPIHVLLLEGDPDQAKDLTSQLSSEELKVTTALSGREAWEHIFLRNFDLIIFDLGIPDSLSIAKRIRDRKESRETPILFLTSRDESVLLDGGYSLGVVDHLSKPVNIGILRSKTRMWVDLTRRLREVMQRSDEHGHWNSPLPDTDAGMRTQEERYRQAVEGAQDSAVIWMDAEGRIVACNSVVGRILGYLEPELHGKPIDLIFFPEDVEAGAPMKELQSARSEGQAVDERWHRRKDGSRFWASGLITPLRDESGDVQGFIKILRDRTDQKVIFDLARASEERFRQLLDSTAEGIFGLDWDGVFTFANAACLDTLGFSKKHDLVGSDFHHIIMHRRPDGRLCLGKDCPILTALREGRPLHEQEAFRRADEPFIQVEFRLYPIRFEGRLTGAVGTFLDITERKKAEARLKAAEGAVRQSQRLESVGRLAGGVAHELNNDLTAIIGYGELMLEMLEPASPLRRDVEEILAGGKRAAELVQKLLAFGGKQILVAKNMDLNGFILEKEERIKGILGGDIRLSIELDSALPKIKADPQKVEQTILNILLNAREAMPNGGMLTLSTSRLDAWNPEEAGKLSLKPGAYACLSIQDTGEGLSEDTQDNLFEPFFNIHSAGRLGKGMGLASAYGFLKQSGGTIQLEKLQAQGAVIRAYFPLSIFDPP